MLTLVIACAAVWCIGTGTAERRASSEHSAWTKARPTLLAKRTPAPLRVHDLPLVESRTQETAAPADHLLFLQ